MNRTTFLFETEMSETSFPSFTAADADADAFSIGKRIKPAKLELH